MACHVVITTLLDRWDAGWLAIEVKPLSFRESVDLIARMVGQDLARRYGARLAEFADGLQVQHVLEAVSASAATGSRWTPV